MLWYKQYIASIILPTDYGRFQSEISLIDWLINTCIVLVGFDA